MTIDPDAAILLRKAMREQRLTFKDAVNQALRRTFGEASQEPFHTPTFDMGPPLISLDKALEIAGEMEAGEIRRTMAQAPV